MGPGADCAIATRSSISFSSIQWYSSTNFFFIKVTIIPPFLVISLISVCYNAFRDNFIVSQMLSGMQAGVGAVIASVTYEMGAGIVHGKNAVSMCIMAGAFLASCVFHINVVFVVIACGLIGALRTLAAERRAKK